MDIKKKKKDQEWREGFFLLYLAADTFAALDLWDTLSL